MSDIYGSAVGLKIILDVVVNISAATVKKIRYIKPSGEVGEWNATLEDSTHISYSTGADDIDEIGIWQFQAYVTCGWTLYGDIANIRIDEPI